MLHIPPWLTFTLVAAVFGGISGLTAWLVNIYNLRKTQREIERLERELEKTNRRMITPDDPHWERVSREVRDSFHHISQEAHEASHRVRRVGNLSYTLPAFIFAALLASLMFAVAMRETNRISARLAAATSELASREKELADLRDALIQHQQQIATLRRELTTSSEQRRQLLATVQQLVGRTRQQVNLAAREAHWAGPFPPTAQAAQQAEKCRQEIQRILPLLDQLDHLSQEQPPKPNAPKDQ